MAPVREASRQLTPRRGREPIPGGLKPLCRGRNDVRGHRPNLGLAGSGALPDDVRSGLRFFPAAAPRSRGRDSGPSSPPFFGSTRSSLESSSRRPGRISEPMGESIARAATAAAHPLRWHVDFPPFPSPYWAPTKTAGSIVTLERRHALQN